MPFNDYEYRHASFWQKTAVVIVRVTKTMLCSLLYRGCSFRVLVFRL